MTNRSKFFSWQTWGKATTLLTVVPGFQTSSIALSTLRAPLVQNGVSTKGKKNSEVLRQEGEKKMAVRVKL